jgi:hypothetical protein
MFLLILSSGFLLLALGMGYLFDPKAIMRLNSMVRDNLVKDSHVLLNGKRIGSVLIFLGFILLIFSLKMPVR